MTTPTVRIINRPNLLKARASQPGGASFGDLVARGNQIVAEHHLDYRTVAESDITELRSVLARMKAAPEEMDAHVEGVFRIAHDMKGQAATFGYPMITSVAKSLCGFIESVRQAAHAPSDCADALSDIVGVHIDALRVLLAHDIKGHGGQIESRLLHGLQTASEKILARIRPTTTL
ncbi:MAG TPA: Hpt domain-containing protein [Alphaproteobacteria bacterium]|nr:Hpt domain-containing protein [Alphaproteobacteria bacterium]